MIFVILYLYIPPEEDAIASKACEIHVSKFVNVREFCPMQQKTIPVENNENVRMNHPFRQSSASSTFYGN